MAVAGLVFLGAAAFAETADEFSVRSWDSRAGLPADEITALARTADGFLWVGMASGLVRFDGERFVRLNTNTTPSLGDSRVSSLVADAAGDLWIGTQGGTVARRHQGNFKPLNLPASLSGKNIRALVEDQGRGVWALSAAGVARLTVTNCQWFPTTNQLPMMTAISGLVDEAGSLLCLAPGNLYTFENGEWVTFDDPPHGMARLLAACAGRGGAAWLGVASDPVRPQAGQILRMQENKFQSALSPYPWPKDSLRTSVQAICEDRRGRLWVGTSGSGVYFWSQQKGWQRLASEGVLANAVVTKIIEEAEGFLWIATQRGGLHRVSEQTVTTLSLPGQGVENVVQAVGATSDGSLWVGTDGGGVFRWRDEKFEAVNEGLASRYVRTMFEDSHTNFWVGTRRGLHRWTGTAFAPVNANAPFNWITLALGEDDKSNLWFAGSGGLVRMQSENEFQIFKKNSGLPNYYLRAITRDRAGKLYLAAPNYGLLRQDGERFELIGTNRWSGAKKICSLHADASGALWITTEGAGLFRFKDEKFRQWTMADGLPDDALAGVSEDASGNLWISANTGIFCCAKSQLETYERSNSPPLLFWQLPVKNGMAGAADNGAWQPQPARLPDGRLCFASQGQLVLFDPARMSRGTLASQPIIEETMVDGAAQNIVADETLRVKSGARQFEFHYTAPGFEGEASLRFRYLLEGVDDKWVDAKTRRVAYYNYLPPGEYKFRVMAGGEDGVWRESSQRLNLEIVPRFWERRSLQITGSLLLLLAVAGSVRLVERARTRRKLQRLEAQHAVERERRRIAQDLHDDIGASVSQLMLLGDMAGRANATPEVARQNVLRMQEKVRELGRAMDETIWAVNPRNDTLPQLVSYLQTFAAEFFEGSVIRFRMDAPTDLPAVPLDVKQRHNLFLAVKEAFSNVAKHSGATEVWLRVRWDGGSLELQVEDDGRGFQPGEGAAEQDGLGNMPVRLAQIGGQCAVQSHPGSGCSVRFTLPLAESG
jgi:ligand-binding sensor domain-containing protein/signal transduction histidine kinase